MRAASKVMAGSSAWLTLLPPVSAVIFMISFAGGGGPGPGQPAQCWDMAASAWPSAPHGQTPALFLARCTPTGTATQTLQTLALPSSSSCGSHPRCVLPSRFQSVLFLLLKHAKCLQSTDMSLPVYKLFNQIHVERCLNLRVSEVFLLFRTSPHSWPGDDGEDEDDVTCSLGLFCIFSHSFSTLVAWQAKCSVWGIPRGTRLTLFLPRGSQS